MTMWRLSNDRQKLNNRRQTHRSPEWKTAVKFFKLLKESEDSLQKEKSQNKELKNYDEAKKNKLEGEIAALRGQVQRQIDENAAAVALRPVAGQNLRAPTREARARSKSPAPDSGKWLIFLLI